MLAPLNAIDVAAIVAVLAFATRGCFRGLSGELASLVSLAVTLVLSLRFYRPLAAWFLEHSRLEGAGATSLAYGCVAIAAFLFMVAASALLKRVLRVVVEEEAERLGGFIAGFLRGAFVVVLIFVAMNLAPQPLLNRSFGRESAVGSLILGLLPEVAENAPARALPDTDEE